MDPWPARRFANTTSCRGLIRQTRQTQTYFVTRNRLPNLFPRNLLLRNLFLPSLVETHTRLNYHCLTHSRTLPLPKRLAPMTLASLPRLPLLIATRISKRKPKICVTAPTTSPDSFRATSHHLKREIKAPRILSWSLTRDLPRILAQTLNLMALPLSTILRIRRPLKLPSLNLILHKLLLRTTTLCRTLSRIRQRLHPRISRFRPQRLSPLRRTFRLSLVQ